MKSRRVERTGDEGNDVPSAAEKYYRLVENALVRDHVTCVSHPVTDEELLAAEAAFKEAEQRLLGLRLVRWKQLVDTFVADEELPPHKYDPDNAHDRVARFFYFFQTNGLPKDSYDNCLFEINDESGNGLHRFLDPEASTGRFDLDQIGEYMFEGPYATDISVRNHLLLKIIEHNCGVYEWSF